MRKRFRFRRILMSLLAILLLLGVIMTHNPYLVPFVICSLVLAFCKDEDIYGKRKKETKI